MPLNVTSIESAFDKDVLNKSSEFVKDILVSCELDVNHKGEMVANVDFLNPFRVVEIEYASNGIPNNTASDISKVTNTSANASTELKKNKFLVTLAPSTLIQVKLSQAIAGESCLAVVEAHLEDKFEYDIECITCTESELSQLESVLSRKAVRFVTSLQMMIGDKVKLGLIKLLSETRVDFENLK